MVHNAAQPPNRVALSDVWLADLPVEPQHQRFRCPAFDIHVERRLFVLRCEPVSDAIAIKIDLEAARRFS